MRRQIRPRGRRRKSFKPKGDVVLRRAGPGIAGIDTSEVKTATGTERAFSAIPRETARIPSGANQPLAVTSKCRWHLDAPTFKVYDIALRDFGLSLGALALGRLAEQFQTR